ncbi:hypothetical protein [Deinococcus aerophilus]|uniref:Uncharacterized protein n=1 Tax=Deinococcus aerophilus TaxID=522488 RepID=A0ABQ2GS36_9DEIO|nr:hypothetical protein [Deinococcus aerophilus]GGM10543.1 hypothetical protein GCM10010841_18760 [Deinococcus aerophilus]
MSEDARTRDELLENIQHASSLQRRRVSEVRAREHVGAAGWAQASTLEAIIRTGQEGLAATEALRQVISLTGEQIRALPLGAPQQKRGGEVQILQDIVTNGQEQMTVAEALNRLVGQALEEVTRTPLSDLNVGGLQFIHARVEEQLTALRTIVHAAQAQAQTLEQVGQLEGVLSEHQRRVDELRHFSAEAEVHALAEAGTQIVERISALDGAAAFQVDALSQIAEAVVDHMGETSVSSAQQAEALEKLAHDMETEAQTLRGQDSADGSPPSS